MTLRFLTAGESHGPALLAILDGLPAGLPITQEGINAELQRRQKGYGAGPRMKIESDTGQILGGVMEGLTTGAPLAVLIENRDHEKWRGRPVHAFTTPRPGHADLTGAVKYGFNDFRPALERASARETAARVAIGAICKQFLAQFGVRVGGYVVSIGEVEAKLTGVGFQERMELAELNDVRCPDHAAAEMMHNSIRQIIQARDTLGGVIEILALGLPIGLGSYAQWDSRLEARLGAAVLSVQAIKGIEIGPAFENTRRSGSQAQDGIALNGETLVRVSDGSDPYFTNRSGGIEGGISTGGPLIIRAAMKPIATTLTSQRSVNLATGEETATQYERSDFCPVPRAVPILEAMVAFVLAGALIDKLGGDSIAEMLPRAAALRQARLSDLPMEDRPHTWWP